MADARFVFVTGVGRSGTTAITELLNAHPKVCLGVERFKRLVRSRHFTPELFTADRFFDFREGDTNILPRPDSKWERLYKDMRRRWPDAEVVGDKIPGIHGRLERMRATFPSPLFVYLLRDPVDVADSWKRRAENPEDRWPAENDHRQAVAMWNEANATIAELGADGSDDVYVVHYEEFFGGSAGALDRLVEFMGVDRAPRLVKRYRATRKQYGSRVVNRPLSLSDEEQERVRSAADWTTYRALLGGSSVVAAPDASV